MAYIEERKIKSGKQYRLVESYREDGKVKHTRTYLGKKPPFSKKRGWKNLLVETVARLKQKAKQQIAKPLPSSNLPEGKFPVIYADPPWRYDFAKVEDLDINRKSVHTPVHSAACSRLFSEFSL